jgi:16S rRNA (guanine966-N2)-methyltransferase
VLDLYAGSGALGLEALSRGAGHVDLVESGKVAAKAIMANITELGAGEATIHRTTAERFVDACTEAYDLVLLDPPYDMSTTELARLVGDLPAGGLVVVERSTRDPFTWPDNRTGLRERAYGETTLWYGR